MYEDIRQQKYDSSHILLLIMYAFLQSVTASDMRDSKVNVRIKNAEIVSCNARSFPLPFFKPGLMIMTTFSEMLKTAIPFCKCLFLLHNRTHSLHLPQIPTLLVHYFLVSWHTSIFFLLSSSVLANSKGFISPMTELFCHVICFGNNSI